MNKQDILELCNLWKYLKRVDSRTSNHYNISKRINDIVDKLREDLLEAALMYDKYKRQLTTAST